MKKIFLSFAALALVAVGTVSCGGDDSSPVTTDTPTTDTPTTDNTTDTPNPGQTVNTILAEGEEFPVTNSELEVEFVTYNAGTEEAFEGPAVYIDNGVAYNQYTQYAYNLNSSNQPDNLYIYGYMAVNPTVELDANGNLVSLGSIQSPTAIEEMMLQSGGVRAGGVVYNTDITGGAITYSTFNVTSVSETAFEYEGTSAFNATLNVAGEDIALKFNGPVVMYGYNAEAPTATSVNSATKKDIRDFQNVMSKKAISKGFVKANRTITK